MLLVQAHFAEPRTIPNNLRCYTDGTLLCHRPSPGGAGWVNSSKSLLVCDEPGRRDVHPNSGLLPENWPIESKMLLLKDNYPFPSASMPLVKQWDTIMYNVHMLIWLESWSTPYKRVEMLNDLQTLGSGSRGEKRWNTVLPSMLEEFAWKPVANLVFCNSKSHHAEIEDHQLVLSPTTLSCQHFICSLWYWL